MPKKIGGRGHYNFIFFLNHVLHKSGRTLGEHYEENPEHFSFIIVIYVYIISLFSVPILFERFFYLIFFS
jgi:hypothetical protein